MKIDRRLNLMVFLQSVQQNIEKSMASTYYFSPLLPLFVTDYCKMCFCSLPFSPYFPIFPERKMLKEMDFICSAKSVHHMFSFLGTTDTKNREENIRCVCEKATNFQRSSYYYFLIQETSVGE